MARPPRPKPTGEKKIHVNLTLAPVAYNLIVAVAKKNAWSLSETIERGVDRAYTDPYEEAVKNAKEHHRQSMFWKERADAIAEERGPDFQKKIAEKWAEDKR